MIVTLTLNPALDKTAELSHLVPGGLNRLSHITVDAGGKGINVSKMIQALHGHSLATGFLGGSSGAEVRRQLCALGIAQDFVEVAETTRTNLKILMPDSGVTELNEPGLHVSAAEEAELLAKLLKLAGPDTTFVLSGSIPVNFKNSYYRDLTRELRQKAAKVFVDADGAALRLALEAAPDLIKPNREELMHFFGLKEQPNLAELQRLCRHWLDMGVGFIALSLGADGALFMNSEQTIYAEGLKLKALSTVGAGDSLVGALAFAREKQYPLEKAAALALAASAGAVTTQGTKAPDFDLVCRLEKTVKLHPLPLRP